MEILEYFSFEIIRVLLKYFLTNLNKNSVFFYLEKLFKNSISIEFYLYIYYLSKVK